MKAVLLVYASLTVLFLVFGFVCFQFLLPKSYDNTHAKRYSRSQMFPAELLDSTEKYTVFARVFIIIVAIVMFLGSGYLLASISLLSSLQVISIFVLMGGVLASFGFAAQLLVNPLNNIRFHVFAFVFFGLMSALYDFGNIIAFTRIPGNSALPYILVVLLGLLGLGKIVLLLNPKLMHWAKLDSKMEEDGTMTYSRPKPFVLALTEWIFIYAHLASMAVGVLGALVLILPLLA